MQHYTPSRFNSRKQHLGYVSVIAAVNHILAGLKEKEICTIKIQKQPHSCASFLSAHITTRAYPSMHWAKGRETICQTGNVDLDSN